MGRTSSRRSFLAHASLLVAGAQFSPWLNVLDAAQLENTIAETSAGRIRGVLIDGTNVFKGIPYGAPTSGRNRFMPPAKATAWTGVRDALAFGPTAPQTRDNSGTTAAGSPAQQSEDCLVLNVFRKEIQALLNDAEELVHDSVLLPARAAGGEPQAGDQELRIDILPGKTALDEVVAGNGDAPDVFLLLSDTSS